MSTSLEFIIAREEVKRAKLVHDEELTRQQQREQFRCNRAFFDRLTMASAVRSSPRSSVADGSSLSILEEARALRKAEQEARLKVQQQRYHEDMYRSKRLQLRREQDAKRAKLSWEKGQQLDLILLERQRAAAADAGNSKQSYAVTPGPGPRSPPPQSGRVTTSPPRVHHIKLRKVVSQDEATEKQKKIERERRELVERRRLENIERLRQVEDESRRKNARKEEEIELLAQLKAEALLVQQIDEKRHHFEKLDEMKAIQREKEIKKHQAAIALANELNAAQRLIETSSARHRGSADSELLSPRRQLQLLQQKELDVRRGKISAEIWDVQFHAASKKLEEEDRRRALEEKKRKGDEIRQKQVVNFSALQEKRHAELRRREEEYLQELRRAHEAVAQQEEEQQKFVKNLKEQGKVVCFEKSAEMEAKKAALANDVIVTRQKSVAIFNEMSMEAREQLRLKIHEAEVAHEKRIRSLEKQKLAEYKASQERQRLEALEREQHAQEQREREEARLRHVKKTEEVLEREKLNSQLYRQYVSEVKEVEVKKSETFYLVKLPEKRPRPFRQHADQTPTNSAMLPPVVPPHPELRGFNFTSEAMMREINAELSAADAHVKSLRRSMRN